MLNRPLQIAVIGAGIAGVSCARRLSSAGHRVVLYEKSRGVGGRMATRHALWIDDQGQPRFAAYDHGTPWFAARTPAFRDFCTTAEDEGWLCRWSPAGPAAAGGDALDSWVALPDMPELCRRLLGCLTLHTRIRIDGLNRCHGRWRLHGEGRVMGEGYDRVVIALPPAQAAPLLAEHRADWAAAAAAKPMQACWTLMGSADPVAGDPQRVQLPMATTLLADGSTSPIESIVQNSAKPCRDNAGSLVHWVVHARPDWSRAHLEDAPGAVQDALQRALEAQLGHALNWRHGQVHRWRFAQAGTDAAGTTGLYWHDNGLGLGVCGDHFTHLAGRAGVENAWLSAQSLAEALCGAVRPNTPDLASTQNDALTPQAIS